MNIGIYIDNRNITEVDCSDLLKGNPGIGGTEYSILLLAQAIKTLYPGEKVILLAEKNSLLPDVDKVTLVDGYESICAEVENEKCDLLVISAIREGKPLDQRFFDMLQNKDIKTVLWSHNFHYSDYCDRIADCQAIKANIFVGRQQYDRYVDHRIIEKSTFIYNMYPTNQERKREDLTGHQVTYIGSLVPGKGFQVLAAAWKQIVREVPDAVLNVIGSGKLYNRNSKLGAYGLAEERFEKTFIRDLVDKDGNILPSVKFHGILGAEKDEIIINTSVGVANPTGRTETFGISALDFESAGVPVVTIARGGFLDTVIDRKTGILIKKTTQIGDAVVKLLLDETANCEYGKAGAEMAAKFAPEIIIKEWMCLFETVIAGKKLDYLKPNTFLWNNLKMLRILNHNLKSVLRIKGGPSVIGMETFAKSMLRRLGR